MCIRNKVIISIFLVIFVLSISQLNAEERELKSTPIEVIAESVDDLVASRLIYEVKEQIRKSYAFRLTTKEEPRYQLRITTQDPLFSLTSEWHNIMTVYSVVWTFEVIEGEFSFPLYLHSAVGGSGRNHLPECAEGILAVMDELIEKRENMLKQLYKWRH